MFNNVFSGLLVDSSVGSAAVVVENHGNNIYGNDPSGSGGTSPFVVDGSSLVNTTPAFADPAAGDYTPTADSVARDFGSAAYAPDTDLAGHPRHGLPDAGALECAPPVQSPVRPSGLRLTQ
jgi:hypothetical protein